MSVNSRCPWWAEVLWSLITSLNIDGSSWANAECRTESLVLLAYGVVLGFTAGLLLCSGLVRGKETGVVAGGQPKPKSPEFIGALQASPEWGEQIKEAANMNAALHALFALHAYRKRVTASLPAYGIGDKSPVSALRQAAAELESHVVAREIKAKHAAGYELRDGRLRDHTNLSWALHPEFLELLKRAQWPVQELSHGRPSPRRHLSASLLMASTCIMPLGSGVFRVRLFSEAFCSSLLREYDYFQQWQSTENSEGPTSMLSTQGVQRRGLELELCGMAPWFQTVARNLIAPLARVLFPAASELACELDHTHSYIVDYLSPLSVAAAADDRVSDAKLDPSGTSLSFHTDDSDVTLNLCLGREFSGGALRFGGIRSDGAAGVRPSGLAADAARDGAKAELLCVSHTPGEALLHLGTQFHSADGLDGGRRTNLIMWCRSSVFRTMRCPCCWMYGRGVRCICA